MKTESKKKQPIDLSPHPATLSIAQVAKRVHQPAAEIEKWCKSEAAIRHGTHIHHGEWRIFKNAIEFGWPPLMPRPARQLPRDANGKILPPTPLETFYAASSELLQQFHLVAGGKHKDVRTDTLRRWFESYDAAYAAAADKNELRADLVSLYGVIGGVVGAVSRIAFLASEPSGVSLREFERGVSAMRHHLAFAAVEIHSDNPQMPMVSSRIEDAKEAVRGVLRQSPLHRYAFDKIVELSGYGETAVRTALDAMVKDKEVIHHGKPPRPRGGYSLHT